MYNEEHGVTIGHYHSWKHWHLIPVSRPVINPPTERTNLVTVAGMDGSWDLSQAVAQRPVYNDREGTLEFYVENDYWDWNTAYTTIQNALGGKRHMVILDDDRSHFYYGAVWVDKWKSDKGHSTIALKYRLNPYKKERYSSVEPWLWDNFNFDMDIIREYVNTYVNGFAQLIVPGTEQANRAEISIVSGTLKVDAFKQMGDNSFTSVYSASLSAPQKTVIRVEYTTYIFNFSGTGYYTVEYRGGML